MSRICEAKSVAVMLLWLLTSPLLVGQIKLPGGITIPVPNQGNQLPNRGRFPGNNRPDLAKVCPPIVTWMQTMATEYPSVDFQHTAVDRLEVMMITLFADPLFEPVFGRPYSKLTEADMQSIGREKLHPCAASPYRSQMIVVVPTDYAFISRLTMHPLSPSRLVSELEALAQARRSLAAEEAAIPALPGTPETYDKLKVLAVIMLKI